MSQNLRVALWLPTTVVAVGDGVVAVSAGAVGEQVDTRLQAGGGAGGAALPPATQQGQLMVAGTGPAFAWQAGNADAGRF